MNASLNGNALILLDHLRYVVGVSVRSAGAVSIRPKAKLTADSGRDRRLSTGSPRAA